MTEYYVHGCNDAIVPRCNEEIHATNNATELFWNKKQH